MITKPASTAQKLLNLYRQQNAIFGGWVAVNAVLVSEGTPEVLAELEKLPVGGRLAQHIINLKSGKTKMNGIDNDMLPYGGAMADETQIAATLSMDEISILRSALSKFVSDNDGLEKIKSLPMVKKFDGEWLVGVRAALADHPDLLVQWNRVQHTDRAYNLWKIATDILNAPLSERIRAQVQADLPEYETYLPMFGNDGKELLAKLRTFVSLV